MIHISVYIALLLVGFVVGFHVKAWLVRRHQYNYNGTMYVTANEEKTLYSLELNDYPETLQFKKHVVFKVETAEETPDRE